MKHGLYRRITARDVEDVKALERRSCAAVKRSGEGCGAAGVGDLSVAEAERLELRRFAASPAHKLSAAALLPAAAAPRG